jgi:antitoxin MazE
MRAGVRRLGNSSGVIIPKPLLAEVGLAAGDAVDVTLEHGRIVLVPLRRQPRAGWAEASRAIAQARDDALAWPEFGDARDEGLDW